MVYSIKMTNEYNFLKYNSRNELVQKLVDKLSEGIVFENGLNFIVGKNGSGKSTILNLIKSSNRCEHSFIPKRDHLSITTVSDLNNLFDSFEIVQDYRLPAFNLYRQKEDRLKNNNLEDGDEFVTFMASTQESKGQNLIGDINQLWYWMFERQSECHPVLKHVMDIHEEGTFADKEEAQYNSTRLIKSFGKNNKLGDLNSPPIFTIVMDEPDNGLDVDNLKEVYNVLSFEKPNTQIIASIHNPLLIYKLYKNVPNANWIQLSDNYIDKIMEEMK